MISLTRRERLLAAGVAVAVGVWALYAVAVKPMRHRIRTLERVIPEQQRELHAIEAKSVEYMALQKRFNDFRAKAASHDPSFQLLPYLETLIDDQGLTRKTISMAPSILQLRPDCSETIVKIDMEDISLRQLVDFLRAIELSEALLQIGSLHIRKGPINEHLLDATVEIYSPRPTTPSPQLAQAP